MVFEIDFEVFYVLGSDGFGGVFMKACSVFDELINVFAIGKDSGSCPTGLFEICGKFVFGLT